MAQHRIQIELTLLCIGQTDSQWMWFAFGSIALIMRTFSTVFWTKFLFLRFSFVSFSFSFFPIFLHRKSFVYIVHTHLNASMPYIHPCRVHRQLIGMSWIKYRTENAVCGFLSTFLCSSHSYFRSRELVQKLLTYTYTHIHIWDIHRDRKRESEETRRIMIVNWTSNMKKSNEFTYTITFAKLSTRELEKENACIHTHT